MAELTPENRIVDIPDLNGFQIGEQVVVDASADNDRFEGVIIGIELRRVYGSSRLEPSITLLHDGYITDAFKPIDCRRVDAPPQSNLSAAKPTQSPCAGFAVNRGSIAARLSKGTVRLTLLDDTYPKDVVSADLLLTSQSKTIASVDSPHFRADAIQNLSKSARDVFTEPHHWEALDAIGAFCGARAQTSPSRREIGDAAYMERSVKKETLPFPQTKSMGDLERQLSEMKAERDLLQDILDSRPAINAALPESYIRWSQAIYSGDVIRASTTEGQDNG